MATLIDLAGETFGRLTVLSRSENASCGRTKWLCSCSCGEKVEVFTSALRSGQTVSCGCRRRETRVENGRRNATNAPSYVGAHQRVYRARGKARAHLCIDCGSPADDWSYDHTDPDEIHNERLGRSVTYSVKPEHYSPRCKPCHRIFDGVTP